MGAQAAQLLTQVSGVEKLFVRRVFLLLFLHFSNSEILALLILVCPQDRISRLVLISLN